VGATLRLLDSKNRDSRCMVTSVLTVVSHLKYMFDRTDRQKDKRTGRRTDRTDGHQTDVLRLPLDAVSEMNNFSLSPRLPLKLVHSIRPELNWTELT